MSLKQSLDNSITKVINHFIDLISLKYNLDKEQLLVDWTSQSDEATTPKTVSSKSVSSKSVLDPEYLLKCKKPELKNLCKQRGLRSTGTKAQLIFLPTGKRTPSQKEKEFSKEK